MKRLRLSAKLALAIIPIGLVALIAAGFIAYNFLVESEEQSETAAAATLAADAIETLKAVWDEEGHARQVYVFDNSDSVDDLASAIERTDDAVQELRDSTADLQEATGGFFGDVAFTLTEDVRKVTDALNQMRSLSAPTPAEITGYHDVASAILAILPKTSSIVSDRVQARDLFTAYYLAEGGQVSLKQEQLIEEFRANEFPNTSATDTSTARATLQSTLEVLEGEFGSWALRANQTANVQSAAILRYTRLPDVNIDTFPLRRNEDILNTSEDLAQGVAGDSLVNAADSEREAYLVAGVAAFVLLLALWGAYVVIRSVVRRVRGVTDAAMAVSEDDLPALVNALQNPGDDIAELKPTQIEDAGGDEVGDLADSFTLLHSTLIEVAGQQMSILRKGVSDIFVTLARRNRSLVDRQLALLDELESTEEDPETLGGYYKLDHLATRMRRNAESLLVLAGSEPTRIWSSPLDVSEIIRAALGEVDDYQRVDIMALEPALVSGRAVADVAHLMSELLDNGTQFSSPTDRVRVAGLFDPDGYMLTVSDNGIGMTDERIDEINQLLDNPPVLGLALQPTLGMYVVARLAARHGIKVQVISGSPGITVRVLLPKPLIESPAVAAPDMPIAGTQYKPSRPEVSAPKLAVVSDDQSNSVLPGKVKGRHEHPRSRQVAAGQRVDAAVEGESPFADEEDAPERPGALKKRVPGEALGAELSRVGEETPETADESAQRERPGQAAAYSAHATEEPGVGEEVAGEEFAFGGPPGESFGSEAPLSSASDTADSALEPEQPRVEVVSEPADHETPATEVPASETVVPAEPVEVTEASEAPNEFGQEEPVTAEMSVDDPSDVSEEGAESDDIADHAPRKETYSSANGWHDVAEKPTEPESAESDADEAVGAATDEPGGVFTSTDDAPWWVDREPSVPEQFVTSEDESEPSEVDAAASADAAEKESSVEEPTDDADVIEMAEAQFDPKEHQPRVTPVGLPVRTPGTSFKETDNSATSSSQSTSGAIGIKSALTEFSDGRSMATQKVEEREESGDEEGSNE